MSGRKSHACSSCIRKKKKCLCGTNQNRTPRTNQNRTPRTAVRPKRARHNAVKYTPTTILRDHASFFLIQRERKAELEKQDEWKGKKQNKRYA